MQFVDYFYNFKSLERFSLSFNAILILGKLLIIKYINKLELQYFEQHPFI